MNGETPVLDFIQSLPAKERAKIIREIDLLEEFGINLPYPHTRKIKSKKFSELWELRIKFSKNITRIFYFLYTGKTFVLLHGIKKKSKKTPTAALEIAKARMEDYLKRKKEDQK